MCRLDPSEKKRERPKAVKMGWSNGATESGGDKEMRARTRAPLTYLYKAVEMTEEENL